MVAPHLGVVLPNYGDNLHPGRLAAAAAAAEEAGLDSGWMTDHVLVPSRHAGIYGTITEALVTVGFLAGRTERLRVPADVPVVTRDQVERAKPDPDLFLAAAERLGADVADAVVVGDSVWDLLAARRARALGIGLLSGGYGREELERAGAYRVYDDPADLLLHLDEVGVRDPGEG